MKSWISTYLFLTVMLLTSLSLAEKPDYQYINYIERPIVFNNSSIPTNVTQCLDKKIHQILSDINKVCIDNNDSYKATKIISEKYIGIPNLYIRHLTSVPTMLNCLEDQSDHQVNIIATTNTTIGTIAESSHSVNYIKDCIPAKKCCGSVYSNEVYPLESMSYLFMNYTTHKYPATFDKYTASFPKKQNIYKLTFNIFSSDQMESINVPLNLSIVKANQVKNPKVYKVVYISLSQPILNKKFLEKISTSVLQDQNQSRHQKTRLENFKYRSRTSIVGVMIILFLAFAFFFLGIVTIILMKLFVTKEKKNLARLAEFKKIDAMATSGKISAEKASELKEALRPDAYLILDNHIKAVGIINIVFGIITFCVILVLWLFPATFMIKSNVINCTITTSSVLVWIPLFFIMGISFFKIICGVKLLQGRPWSRIAIIIFAMFSILNIPLGTGISIYTLWVMFFRENAGSYFMKDSDNS